MQISSSFLIGWSFLHCHPITIFLQRSINFVFWGLTTYTLTSLWSSGVRYFFLLNRSLILSWSNMFFSDQIVLCSLDSLALLLRLCSFCFFPQFSAVVKVLFHFELNEFSFSGCYHSGLWVLISLAFVSFLWLHSPVGCSWQVSIKNVCFSLMLLVESFLAGSFLVSQLMCLWLVFLIL